MKWCKALRLTPIQCDCTTQPASFHDPYPPCSLGELGLSLSFLIGRGALAAADANQALVGALLDAIRLGAVLLLQLEDIVGAVGDALLLATGLWSGFLWLACALNSFPCLVGLTCQLGLVQRWSVMMAPVASVAVRPIEKMSLTSCIALRYVSDGMRVA